MTNILMHEIGTLTHGVFSVLINGMPIANTVIHLIDRVSCLYVFACSLCTTCTQIATNKAGMRISCSNPKCPMFCTRAFHLTHSICCFCWSEKSFSKTNYNEYELIWMWYAVCVCVSPMWNVDMAIEWQNTQSSSAVDAVHSIVFAHR